MAEQKAKAGSPGLSAPLIDEIASWIMAMSLGPEPLEAIFGGTCERLFAAGVPLARAHIAFSVLHPLYSGMGNTWRRGHGLEVSGYAHRADNEGPSPAWLQSPLYHAVQHRLPFLRRRLTGPDAVLDFPFLEDLRAEGITDYFAYTIRFGGDDDNGMVGSWSTDRPSGFGDADLVTLRRIQQRLAVACRMRVHDQIAENVVTTYLGRDAGLRVLDGKIRRGDGEITRSVFWYCDLRGSTRFAARLDADVFIGLLNDYFEVTAGSVMAHGGDILSFIGDAVLAQFPIGDGPGAVADACNRAAEAQAEASRRLAALNADREARGHEPLHYGLGLHMGEAVFGNIGVPERLAFTVIGAPVNVVARLEEATKTLGEPVLATAALAENLSRPWRSVGSHELRGIAGAMELFAPPA